MSSCLGLYIENNLIKYAKVTKERDSIKIDSFGIKFYDKIGEAIHQIISETSSYKTPISVNISEETYEYFYFSNLLSKNDLRKSIETEFESYCYDKGYNQNALESCYALVPDLQNKEKIKVIHISANKAKINETLQELEGKQISHIAPLSMCIANIMNAKEKENVLIVNLEAETTLTTIIKQNIFSIDKIEKGIKTILSTIKEKENSYAKAYEICKDTTIYTMDEAELLEEGENRYLEDIMPTLYDIVQRVKAFVDNSFHHIEKIYITGTGSMINNVDLYFQEYFPNIKCEILKPYFISNNKKINVKDYIEVNSATALAIQGLGFGVKGLNFKKISLLNQLPEFLKIETGLNKATDKEKKINKRVNFSFDLLKEKLDPTEKWFLRTGIALLSFVVIYFCITTFIKVQTNNKLLEIQEIKDDTNKQLSAVNKDIQTLNNKAAEYQRMTERLKNYNKQEQQNLKTKNMIPVLLTKIMNVIPKGVTITSIENTTESHIIIYAQSEDYDLLGFFKGSLIVEEILSPNTVVSTSGVKQDGLVKIVIEGDMP